MPTRTVRALTVLFVIALIAASCGGGGDEDSNDTGNESSNPGASATTAESGADDLVATTDAAPNEEDASATTEAPVAPPPGGLSEGTAVISLENGEVFEFSILCALLPQPNFEYTIVSYDDPANLDISKWSEDAQFSGTNVSIYDSTTYDTLWEARSEVLGAEGELELTISGSTVSGSGTFWPGGDIFQDGVPGDILANC